MKIPNPTFLVLGGTGRTGQHFMALALKNGHRVKALVRNPAKLAVEHPNLELIVGSIVDFRNLDTLLDGVDVVVSMLGDARLQSQSKMNTHFVQQLIPAMRRKGIRKFLYQAGGLTRRYKERLPLITWILRNTIARYGGLIGQHEDNEAVIEYLVEQAKDIEWVVHRASIISDGPTKGVLKRSSTKNGLATFGDCAFYNYHLATDEAAIHTYDLSCY